MFDFFLKRFVYIVKFWVEIHIKGSNIIVVLIYSAVLKFMDLLIDLKLRSQNNLMCVWFCSEQNWFCKIDYDKNWVEVKVILFAYIYLKVSWII
jgi:hypothetical protein